MRSTRLQDMTDVNIKERIADLFDKGTLLPPLFLQLVDCTLSIRCSSEVLKQQLEKYFAPFVLKSEKKATITVTAIEHPGLDLDLPFELRQPEPGKTGVKEAWIDLDDIRIIRKLKTGMFMMFGGMENLVVGPCSQHPNQVINFVNNRFIEWKLNQGAFLGHAAAVIWKKQGLAIAGFSGMGKSTLALHLMHDGADFVSNDRLLIDRAGGALHMTGVAKWPRINPGTALNNPSLDSILTDEEKERFSGFPSEQLWTLEQKYDVLVDQCFGAERFCLTSPLDQLCLLNWQRGAGELQVKEIDLRQRPELLPALMKDTGLFYLPEKGMPKNYSLEQYLEVLQGCQVIELSGGIDFQQAVRALRAGI